MEQARLGRQLSFLEKWTPRLNLGLLIALGVSLIAIIILSFVLLIAAIGSGDGPAPHDTFTEVVKVLLGFFNICFVSLALVAGIVLPILNAFYLQRHWLVIPKGRRVFSLITLAVTGLLFIFIVLSVLVSVIVHLTP